MSEVKKVVLAYSGGLDTSIIIPWLKEHYNNCEVIAVCGNVGQKGELEGLEERAKASGASKLYIEDLTDEFVEDYVIPTMQAGADYEGYLLGTSFARPILAKRVVEIARAEGADAVCHGSTGKGNDQVRFELAITFGELVYDGQWFSPLRKALSAFVTSTQEHVTGKVRLELYKGNLINAGVWSPFSLYREDIATFAAGGDYKQSDATGFISIYGLPTKVQAIVNSEKEGE
ncbi:argininosuccinate synthase domain-containing protein [Faecalibacterium prausnitzii]|jgi:argininosuccinate synthase|uniref:Argininosuccinate synthase n=1 Tax=Faecalibacterium prausnitzii TaxID=853 RepID=A0A2A7A6F3_9FIRM|nr:argininosuccinate synthase domain-containing protein [Faecalibacterium prausnitzii]MBV0898343.1 argininosuccinate synthase [Faecalibacterium prausnitzii]MCQ5163077.1 argininosuccinate synthase [Faecalibacterium prausnitzii]MCQ5177008.1 argininosuccinate synthase [Faecalibacterium prausnitzii]PDX74706.1 argininosuccinate synthase [Faecalibacterium prausnitzii]